MTGTTNPDQLPYPDDYNQPADVPAAIEALAVAVQVALDLRALITSAINSGNGLTGGGDLSVARTLAVGAGTGISVAADSVGLDLTYTDGRYAPKGTQIVAGNGLTGGGDLSASRTLNVAVGTGLTVAADSVALDVTYTDGRYVNATGDTVSGNLTVTGTTTLKSANPTGTWEAAPKSYVDSRIQSMTQAAYDALPTKDPTVLYVISG